MKEMVNLLDFDVDGLVAWLAARGEKPFRARQVVRWLHRFGVSDFAQMTNVAKSLRARDRMASSRARALWLDHILPAEKATRRTRQRPASPHQ